VLTRVRREFLRLLSHPISIPSSSLRRLQHTASSSSKAPFNSQDTFWQHVDFSQSRQPHHHPCRSRSRTNPRPRLLHELYLLLRLLLELYLLLLPPARLTQAITRRPFTVHEPTIASTERFVCRRLTCVAADRSSGNLFGVNKKFVT
jgi:hypothetical protein